MNKALSISAIAMDMSSIAPILAQPSECPPKFIAICSTENEHVDRNGNGKICAIAVPPEGQVPFMKLYKDVILI